MSGVLPIANGGTGQSTQTGTGLPVAQTSPTINTPTLSVPVIADFSSATHSHQNAASGGTLGTNAINDDAITAAKMLYGMVRYRQGGAAGDASWYTAGTTDTATDAKNVFIQVGSIEYDGAGADTVTFPSAYSQVPLVFLTPSTAVSANTFAVVQSISTTNFTYQLLTDAGGADAERVSWMAIGQ